MNHETPWYRAAWLLLFFGVLSTIGCKNTDVLWQGRPVFEDDARESAVRDRLEAYYADFSARDWDAFASHFWPGATITTIWQPPGESQMRVVSSSVPAFVEQAPDGPGSKEIFSERMKSSDLQIEGTIAVAWVTYDAEFGDPGDVRRWTGKDVVTLMINDGVWKIVSLAFQSDE